MKHRILTILASLAATPALADPGLHHHPHGVAAGWIVAAAVLLGAPGAAVLLRKVRK
jgi:hypothetical protein